MGIGMAMGMGLVIGIGEMSRVPHIHVCHKFYGMLHVAVACRLSLAFPGTFFEDVVQSKVVAS